MTRLKTILDQANKIARLMVGIPDYETYVAHRKAHHPDEPIMSYEEFYWECQRRHHTVEKGKFTGGCC